MKFLYFVLFATIALFACNSSSTESKKETEEEKVRTVKESNSLRSLTIINPVRVATSKRYDVSVNNRDTTFTLYNGYIYEFNEKGNYTSIKHFMIEGNITNETKYYYDEDENLIKKETFDQDGKLLSYSIAEETDSLNVIKMKLFGKDNEFIADSYIFEDENGNVIKDITQGTEQYFAYDEFNDLVEYRMVMTNYNVDSRFVYEYKEDDLPISTTNFDKDGNIISKLTHVYEFDKKGNWIKKYSYNGKELVELETREYSY